ncbi:MAG: hypothetical protein ACMXYA_02035, partial [Candidatus Woesearchaeota archaeon]
HMSGNIQHKVQKYIKQELAQNHHPETIHLQLLIHQYPEHIIQNALQEVLQEQKYENLVHHMKPNAIRIENVQKLVSKIEKDTRSFIGVYEEYEQNYTMLEIKLAYRLARHHIHTELTIPSLQKMEFTNIYKTVVKVHEYKERGLSKEQIVSYFDRAEYDPQLIIDILDYRKPQLDKLLLWIENRTKKGYTKTESAKVLIQKGWPKHLAAIALDKKYYYAIIAKDIQREYEQIVKS